MSFPAREDLIDFVYDEARLLDEQQFEEWLGLWAPDSLYWMPLEYKQTDPDLVTSLLYEDEFLRKMRVHRLTGQRTFSQQPRSRCNHVLNRPRIVTMNEDRQEFVTETRFHYVETRLDD